MLQSHLDAEGILLVLFTIRAGAQQRHYQPGDWHALLHKGQLRVCCQDLLHEQQARVAIMASAFLTLSTAYSQFVARADSGLVGS